MDTRSHFLQGRNRRRGLQIKHLHYSPDVRSHVLLDALRRRVHGVTSQTPRQRRIRDDALPGACSGCAVPSSEGSADEARSHAVRWCTGTSLTDSIYMANQVVQKGIPRCPRNLHPRPRQHNLERRHSSRGSDRRRVLHPRARTRHDVGLHGAGNSFQDSTARRGAVCSGKSGRC